jgi:hypothetical protein
MALVGEAPGQLVDDRRRGEQPLEGSALLELEGGFGHGRPL